MSRIARVIVADPPWSFGDKLPGKGRGAEKHYKVLTLSDIQRFPLPDLADDAILFLWRVSSQVEEAYAVVRAWGFVPKAEIVWIKTTDPKEFTCPECGSHEFGTSNCRADHSSDMTGNCHGYIKQENGSAKKCEFSWNRGDDARVFGKIHFGMGHYTRAAHETCVIATRGSFKVADRATRSVFSAPVGKHSEKPQAFFDLVERLCGAKGEQNDAEDGGPFIELFARKPRPGWHTFGDELDMGYVWTPRTGQGEPVPLVQQPAPGCAGPNASAFDCPVHDPKKIGATREELPPPSGLVAPEGSVQHISPAGTTAWSHARAVSDAFVDPTPCEPDPSLPEFRHFPGPGAVQAMGDTSPPRPTHVTADLGTHAAVVPEADRAEFLRRAVRDQLLTVEEARDPAEGWIKLQFRAPSGFFDPPQGENLSKLANDLKLADHPVHLVVLAGWSPFQRTMLAEWVRQRNLALVDSPLDLPPVPPFLAEEVAKNPKAELPAEHAARATARVRIPANTPPLVPDVDASTVIENMSPSLAAVVAAGDSPKAKRGRKPKGGSPQTEVSAASILGWDAAKKISDAHTEDP